MLNFRKYDVLIDKKLDLNSKKYIFNATVYLETVIPPKPYSINKCFT